MTLLVLRAVLSTMFQEQHQHADIISRLSWYSKHVSKTVNLFTHQEETEQHLHESGVVMNPSFALLSLCSHLFAA